jgi:hypothetical protein
LDAENATATASTGKDRCVKQLLRKFDRSFDLKLTTRLGCSVALEFGSGDRGANATVAHTIAATTSVPGDYHHRTVAAGGSQKTLHGCKRSAAAAAAQRGHVRARGAPAKQLSLQQMVRALRLVTCTLR